MAPIFAVWARQGEGGVGMWDSGFWRLFLGAVAMGLLFAAQRHRIVPRRGEFRGGYGWLWLPGLAFAGDILAWHWSFEHTSVANSTLLANTSILWVTLFAWRFWGERPTRLFVIGASLAFAGMAALMLSSTTREPPTDGDPVFGDILALLTSLFYATYQLLIKRFRREHSAPRLLFWSSTIGALILFPVAWLGPDPFWPGSLSAWGSLLGLGVLSHACGQGLIAYGLGGVPASLAAVALLLQPAATAVLGLILLGQSLVPMQVVGAVIVVGGLFLAIRSKRRSRARAAM